MAWKPTNLYPYHTHKHKAKKGDFLVYQTLNDTHDFYRIGGAGAMVKNRFKRFEILDDEGLMGYYPKLEEIGAILPRSIHELDGGIGYFRSGTNLHIIEEQHFAVWIQFQGIKKAG